MTETGPAASDNDIRTGDANAPAGPADAAAKVLAVLAALGIDGADPATWPGLVGTSAEGGIYRPGQLPSLSPSKVESLANCPLSWALNKTGGNREASAQASLGSLIHQLAELYPTAGPDEMREHLRAHWPELGLTDNYSSRRLLERALEMARRLGVYLRTHPELEASEVEIDWADATGAELPVRLTGRIDRIEPAGQGRVRIVDFKTGSKVPSAREAETNPQLGAYQAAIDAGLVPPYAASAGAALVYLGAGANAPSELTQESLAQADNPDWMIELLEQCAQAAMRSDFEARPSPRCSYCAVKTSCPAWPEGKQVIA
ncbi:MAG: PD-(D/E)XK nuclease family protein [Bifidobacteriaceae bacterium]|nr:PD-(D/E)XK nuclease family protein [Bifidobacteriaceae bacterium]